MTPEQIEQRDAWEQEIARGARIGAFLGDSLVQGVFQALELSYYNAWRVAETPAEREKLHAQASAFDDLRASLQGIVESGHRATLDIEEQARGTD